MMTGQARHSYFNRRFQESLEQYSRALEADPEFITTHLGPGLVYGQLGDHDRAIAAFQEALRLMPRPQPVALALLGLGDAGRALDWLEKAYENRSGAIVYLRVEPLLDPLRPDPRFSRLLRRAGLER